MYFIIGLLLSSIIFVQAEFHRFEFNITSDVVNPDCFETGVKVPHINGQFPGPAIYVQQGDKVEIIVRNQMNDFNTSIHYHGIRQIGSVDSDGVPGVTQIPIHPGSFYTQRFKVTQQAGTYFYHAHVGLQDDSVQGSFIVYESDLANPKKTAGLLQAGPYRYKKDLVLQLSEWWHEPLDSRQAYYTSSSFTFDHGSDSILMNGRTVFDPTAQSEKSCQGYTTFDVEPNTVYRLRVIGANSFRTLALAIKHHNLTMIEVDGELIHPHETSYLEITPGQRFSVLLKTADHPVGSTFAIGTSYLWRQRGRGVTENGFGYIRYVRPSQITEENSTALFKPILRWNGKKNGFDKRDDLIDSDNSRFEGRRGENDRGSSHHNDNGRSGGNREEHGRSGNNHDDNNRSGGNREEHGRVEDSPRGVRPGGNREEHGRSGGNHDDNNRSGGNRDDNNRSGGNREESNLPGDNREELGRVEGNPRGDFGGHRGGGRSDGNREGGRSEGNREEHGSVEDGPRGEFGGRPGGGRPGGGHGGGDGGGRVGGGEGGGGRQGGGGGQWGGGGGRPPRKEKVYEDLPLFPKVDEPDWIWHKLKPLAERNPILDEIDVRTITLVTSTMKMEDNTTRYLVNHRHTPMGYEPLTETFKQCKNPTYTNDQDEYNEELGTYRLSHNEVVDLVFQNTKNAVGGCLLHPWHTHGHSHYVIASGLGSYQHEKDKHIRNFENPIFKDTTVVYPSIPKEETEGCGWTKVRIIADNPGFWAVHCHITTHMIQGKMIILEEAPKLISKYNLYPRN